MFNIYMSGFNQNGTIINTETLVQTIPAATEGDLKLITPIPKAEMGNAESFTFSIENGTRYYDAFRQMKTYIRITYDGTNIFYGRVIAIDDSFFGTRKIRCEGPLSFLIDSPVEGTEEKDRPSKSIRDYLESLLSNHNNYIENDPYRSFSLGNVPGNYSANISAEQQIENKSRKFGQDSWTDSKAAIEDLRSHYGGYLRARLSGGIGSHVYLDWMNHYFNSQINTQMIEVGKNIIDLNTSMEVDNIFTAIIPIGNNHSESSAKHFYIDGKILRVPDICAKYGDALNTGYHKYSDYANAINKYGLIIKTISFDDAENKSELYEKACEWIKNNYQGEVIKFSIKAVDMHQIGDSQVSKILVGDRVKIRYPEGSEEGHNTLKETTLTCMSIQYDLYNPENNQYVFGIPANIMTKSYGLHRQSKSNTAGTSTGGRAASSGTGKGSERDWIDAVREFLVNHLVYYKSSNPAGPLPFDETKRSYMSGPYAGKTSDTRNYFLSFQSTAVGDYSIWKATATGTQMDSEFSQETYDHYNETDQSGASANLYKELHSNSHTWNLQLMSSSEFSADVIMESNLISYIKEEYGIDIRTGLQVKMPAQLTLNNGQTIFTEINDGDAITKGIFEPGTTNGHPHFIWTDANGREISSIYDAAGNIHYYIHGKDGEPEEINLRELAVDTVKTNDLVGSVINESLPDGTPYVYHMTLGIENYLGAQIVTARVEGDTVILGNPTEGAHPGTGQQIRMALNNITDVCGEYDLEVDEVTGERKLVIKDGTGLVMETKPDQQGHTAKFGVFHDGNLTGGIMVDKINNDGTVTTKIMGSRVDIQASDFASWGIYTDQTLTGGIIAQKLGDGTVTTTINGDLINLSLNSDFTNMVFDQYGLNTRVGDVEAATGNIVGSDLWLQQDKIMAVSGQFEVVTDPVTGEKYINVISGGGLKIKKDNTEFGLYHEGNLTGGIISEKLNDGTVVTNIKGDIIEIGNNKTLNTFADETGETITTIQGSDIWINRDNIANVVGNFSVETNEDTGEKSLVIHDGVGLMFEAKPDQQGHVAKFGVFTENNLTGGIISEKLNDGTVETKIKGDIVDITANQIVSLGFYNNKNLTGGILVEKINDNDVTTTIKGDRILIDGTTKISDAMTITEGNVNIKTGLLISDGGISKLIHLKNGMISAHEFRIIGSATGEHYDLNATTIKEYIKKAEVSEDGKTLTLTRVNGTTVNFNKGTGQAYVTGSWGSGANANKFTYEVTDDDTKPTSGSITVYTGFTNNQNGNFVYTFTQDTTGNVTERNSMQYVLALNGNTVEIQNASGTKITGTATLDATSLYNSGKANANITGKWEQSNPQSSSNPYNKFTVRNTDANPEIVLSEIITVSQSYDSTTHTYTATVDSSGKTGSVITGTTGTEAYEAGWKAAKNSVGTSQPPTTAIAEQATVSSLTFKYPSATVNGTAISYKYDLTIDNNYAYIKYGTSVVAKVTNTAYANGRSNGWTAAYNKVSLPGQGSNETFDVLVPPSALDGDAVTKTFTIAKGATPASTGYASVSLNGIVVGRIDIGNWYTTGKADATVTGAWEQSNPQSSANPYNKFTVRNPNNDNAVMLSETVNVSQSYNSTTHKYTATVDATNMSSVITAETGTEAYTAGQNSVNVERGTWNGGQITFSPSAGTGATKSVTLSAGSASWSNNTATVTITDTTANQTAYTVTVTAPLEKREVTITPGSSQSVGTYTPSSGKIGMSQFKVTVNAVSHSVSGFDTSAPLNASAGGYTNNTAASSSSGYYLNGSGSTAIAAIVVKCTWTCDGVSREAYGYLSTSPTALYKNGYSDGQSNAPHSVAGFGTTAPANASYKIGSTTYTNNASGYVVMSGSGSSANVTIITQGTWQCDGVSRSGTNYLTSAPTAIYRDAYSAGNSDGIVTARNQFNNDRFGTYAADTTVTIGGHTNNSSGYYVSGSGSSATAGIVVRGHWNCDGTYVDAYDYLQAAPTNLYRDAYASGQAHASHSIGTSFDTSSPAGAEFRSYTNNNDGYMITGSGTDATVRIVVKGTWTCDGVSKTANSYLQAAPTAVYKKGYADGGGGSGGGGSTITIKPTWVGLWDSDPRLSFDVNYIGDVNGAERDQWALIKANDTPISCFRVMASDSGGISYNNSGSITQVLDEDDDVFYGELYVKSGSSYTAITGSNYYWYFSTKNIGSRTVHW